MTEIWQVAVCRHVNQSPVILGFSNQQQAIEIRLTVYGFPCESGSDRLPDF